MSDHYKGFDISIQGRFPYEVYMKSFMDKPEPRQRLRKVFEKAFPENAPKLNSEIIDVLMDIHALPNNPESMPDLDAIINTRGDVLSKEVILAIINAALDEATKLAHSGFMDYFNDANIISVEKRNGETKVSL